MRFKLSELFTLKGTIGPAAYLSGGVSAYAIKYLIDRQAAAALLHKPWMPWDYIDPVGTTGSLLLMGPSDRRFLFVMSLIALPFIWLGISLTVRRLRSMAAPLALVVLFFIPFLNLLFFLLLSLIPPRPPKGPLAKEQFAPDAAPTGPFHSFKPEAVAAFLSALMCVPAVWLAAKSSSYGFGVFVSLPFCLGLVAH